MLTWVPAPSLHSSLPPSLLSLSLPSHSQFPPLEVEGRCEKETKFKLRQNLNLGKILVTLIFALQPSRDF